MLGSLLSHIRALASLEQHFHWKASGDNYFGDHMLFDRLYNETNDLLDSIAEKSVGLFGADSIDVIEDAALTQKLLTQWKSDEQSPSIVAQAAVKFVVAFITSGAKELRESGKMSEGLENLIQGVADKLESHIYLLQQRNKQASFLTQLVKVANVLDFHGLFTEADEIDALIKEAASRYNHLIRALKEDNLGAVKSLMSHISPSDLRLTDDEFRRLAKFIWLGDLPGARELLGIIKGNPDASLGKPSVSPHLKDFFIPEYN